MDDATLGKLGGRLVTYENVGRRITEGEFITLVGSGWIGTTPPQSTVLETLLSEILSSGKTVAMAVQSEVVDAEVT